MPIIEREEMVNQIGYSASTNLRLILNRACQLRCTWCYEEGTDYKNTREVLTPDTFIRVTKAAQKQGFTSVNFSGGEPLIYRDLFRVQQEAADTGMKSYVTTNGVLIERRNADEIWKSIPNLEVHVSLNTLDSGEYANITGRRMLQPVKRGIARLAESGIPFSINTVVAGEADWPRVENVINYAGEVGAPVKLLGIHDSDQSSFSQKAVAKMLLKEGATHDNSSSEGGVNYGFEQFTLGDTKIHVLNMLYGGGCCERFQTDQCGEGIRYPRVIYTGEVKPCLHLGIGSIDNNSSDQKIADTLKGAQQFIRGLAKEPYALDSIRE